MRRLAKTLLAGGRIYPVGTAESDIDGKVAREDVWAEGEESSKPTAKRPTKRAESKKSD